ncbi:MAG: hypothetical protein ACRC8T_00185 [Acidaminococcaceae bacterium]
MDKSKLRKCKYHQVAHFEGADVLNSLKEYDGFVELENYDKIYDANCHSVPAPEFAITHESRLALDREKIHSNKEIIAELYKTINEMQGSEGVAKAREFFRREIGCYTIDEEKLYLALQYQKDEIRILGSIIKKIKANSNQTV